MIYIQTQFGLGDLIITNGLIRKLTEVNLDKQISLFVQEKTIKNIEFMYRDLRNKINLIGVSSHEHTNQLKKTI